MSTILTTKRAENKCTRLQPTAAHFLVPDMAGIVDMQPLISCIILGFHARHSNLWRATPKHDDVNWSHRRENGIVSSWRRASAQQLVADVDAIHHDDICIRHLLQPVINICCLVDTASYGMERFVGGACCSLQKVTEALKHLEGHLRNCPISSKRFFLKNNPGYSIVPWSMAKQQADSSFI